MKKYNNKINRLLYKDIAVYICYFGVMVILAYAQINGLTPFHIGMYVALIYCRQNYYAVSGLYLIAVLINNFSWEGLILSITPIAVFGLAKLVHFYTKKPLTLLLVNLYALLSQLPVILLNISNFNIVFKAVISVVVAQIFTYCVSVFLRASIVRGIKYKFNKDELFGGGVLLLALSMGLFKLRFLGITPFYFIMPLLLLMLTSLAKPIVSLVLATIIGLGAGFVDGNIMIIGGLLVPTVFALVFATNNIYYSGVAYFLGDLLCGMYFNSFGAYDYARMAMVVAGILVAMLIPKQAKDYVRKFLGEKGNESGRNIVYRNRREMNAKLNNLATVFYDIGQVLGGGNIEVSTANAMEIAKKVEDIECTQCPNNAFCTNMLGDTANVIKDLVARAISVGKVTATDAPNFLAGRCTRLMSMLNNVNQLSQTYVRRVNHNNQIGAGRIILGEQMVSVSNLLRDLGENMLSNIKFDIAAEKKIIEELAYKNIICNDIIVSGDNGEYGVSLVVRKQDGTKSVLLETVQKVLKQSFIVSEINAGEIVGYSVVSMIPQPSYSIVYGVSNSMMEGSIASGDTFSIEQLGQDKTMIALCDGMGSGKEAHYNSCTTIGMIENFYKAGFENNAILSLINKILSTFNKENFTCLDMCIFDLNKGIVDVIKLGGVQSLLKRGEEYYVFESGALPLGIVEEATPNIERRTLIDNDLIIMFSDGILDSLGLDGIKRIIDRQVAKNPQVLADAVLQEATFGGAKDDSTIICAKIIAK